MKQQTTLSEVFTRTKNLKLVLGIVTTVAISNNLNAQNTSYNANNVPIGGSGGFGNVAFGTGVLTSGSLTGDYNAAIGYIALQQNTTGISNVAGGTQALYANTTGSSNVAIGRFSLYTNTSGSENVANGYRALYSNTTSSGLVAIGTNALFSNTGGTNNSATGYNALYFNTTGRDNTANGGYNTLYKNTTGGYNTAMGSYALTNNISSNYNSAFGYQALQGSNAVGNTSMGFRSSYLTTTGANNTAIGYGALYTNDTGNNNTAVGYLADVSFGYLSNTTTVGNGAIANVSNKVRIGNASVTVIEGQVAYSWPSDGRFKTNVKEEDVKGLEFIKKLRPVVYNFDTRKFTEFWTKNMPDSIRQKYMAQDFTAATNIRQSGFIAQEVESAAKEVNYDFNGVHVPENDNDNYSLAYAEFVVPLVKGMQEQQKMIEGQKLMIEKLQQQINDLQKGMGTTGIDNSLSMASASMEQNVPNPFSHETVIKFNLPDQVNNAYMTVYDLSGKEIKTLPIMRGDSSITLTADQLEAGMYIYSIIVDGKIIDSKRMVVNK